MRKFVIALVALGLLVLSLPAMAIEPGSKFYQEEGGTYGPGGGGMRTNDCLGTIVWDTGMFDEFTPPTGCSSAGSVVCFVNAGDSSYTCTTPPCDLRRIGDDWISDGTPVTGIKIWVRYNVQGYDYHLAYNGLHGFCVKFYEALAVPPFCPDGSVPGELAIGNIAYESYVGVGNFTEFEITTGVPRNFNYCLTLTTPFFPVAGRVYFTSVSGDFDFVGFEGGVTQFFWRVYPGLGYNPYCEASWWDIWNTPNTNWNAISVAINLPCWAGWDASFVLYNNYVPPVPTQKSSWGAIKNQYK